MTLFSYTSFALLISGALGYGITILLSKRFQKFKKSSIDCILFSPCDMHCSKTNFPCDRLACPLCGFKQLCNILKTATSELDICMYLITEPEIFNIIVKLYMKGVKIRVITDKQMSEDAHKSKSGLFAKFKIPLKHINTKGMMHNKFFVLDRKLVVTGSCNWTQNGFMSNYENLVVIRNEDIAGKFIQYFNNLWSEKWV